MPTAHRFRKLLWWIGMTVICLSLAGVSCRNADEQPAGREADTRPVIAVIPKVADSRYFQLCFEGMKSAPAAEQYRLMYLAPESTDNREQVAIVDRLLTEPNLQAILISCNDPALIAPALLRARKQGVLVATFDADSAHAARDLFINQATGEQIGRQLADNIAETLDRKGSFAVLTSVLTAPNQNEWLRWMKIRIRQKYPELELVTISPAGEDKQRARREVRKLLKRHPKVDAVVPITSVALDAVVEYMRENELLHDHKLAGLPYPDQLREYIRSRRAVDEQPWNVRDLGKLAMQCVHMELSGEPIVEGMVAAGVGPLTYLTDEKEVIIGLSHE
ncbi:MAG: substrate-binding domain-containing protein [Phycisphaerae bacterium]